MAILSDLQQDLVEEVLARVPLTSIKAVRFTCKKWNDLSKDGSFIKKLIAEAKKKQAKEFEVIMIMYYRAYLISGNLNNVDPSIKFKGRILSLNDANRELDIYRVIHCDGLLLCTSSTCRNIYYFRLGVWNPYVGQTRWIKPRNSYNCWDTYALGYENNNLYKVLRMGVRMCEFELYSLKSNSWKVLDITYRDWDRDIDLRGLGFSLKGNTYWYAKEKVLQEEEVIIDFLICFDFTTERFGPRLSLPLKSPTCVGDTICLSSVGEEQLAVLFQKADTFQMEVWVTSKIEPKEVSWNKFLEVDMTPLTNYQFHPGSFLIDQKQNVVVFDRDKDVSGTRIIAYIIGKKGYFKKVDLGESTNPNCYPYLCSYVPSSVQIEQLT